VLTVASGLYAYNTVAHDTPSHAAMTLHRDWALATVGLFSLLTIWSLAMHIPKLLEYAGFRVHESSQSKAQHAGNG
ncbi:MAG: hypothetical protein GQ470_05195, partial [Gammaproteobacteria bacterium]|nr:hypothetical protein [Gammaproteobacteria bacterium]